MARLLPTRHAFFLLKALNLLAITAYSFQLVYVLVRVLSLDIYPVAVLISSFGVYIINTDLGYSGFVYYRTRQSFLSHARPHGTEAEVFSLYLAIAIAGGVAVSIVVALLPHLTASIRIAMALYFFSIVLALPWNLMRKIAAAVDLYLSFEIYEFCRRIFFVIAASAMLGGLPFMAFATICLLAWAVAFAMAIHMLRMRRGLTLLNSSAATVVAHLKANYRNIWQSGSLTLVEFAIYNFPYLAIPFLFTDKTLIVAFDVFYKVVRFGAVAYSVPAETVLPGQTRAFYAHDRPKVMRSYWTTVVIGLLPLATALVVLLVFGDRIFTVLLSRGGIVDAPLRLAMALMLAAMLFQNGAGTFLLGTGNYAQLSRFALATLGLMGGVVGVTWAGGLSFRAFMGLYVAVYCVHAMFYSGYFTWFVGPARFARVQT